LQLEKHVYMLGEVHKQKLPNTQAVVPVSSSGGSITRGFRIEKGQHCCNSKGEPAASTNFLGGMMPGSLQHVARRKKTWHD